MSSLENEWAMVLFWGRGQRLKHLPGACIPPHPRRAVANSWQALRPAARCGGWLLRGMAARPCCETLLDAAAHSPLPFGASLLQVGEEEDGEGEGSPAAGESHGLLGGRASSRHGPRRLLGVSGRTLFGSTSGSGGSGPSSGWWGRLRGLGQLWRSSMQGASSSGGSRGGADWSGGGSGGVQLAGSRRSGGRLANTPSAREGGGGE